MTTKKTRLCVSARALLTEFFNTTRMSNDEHVGWRQLQRYDFISGADSGGDAILFEHVGHHRDAIFHRGDRPRLDIINNNY